MCGMGTIFMSMAKMRGKARRMDKPQMAMRDRMAVDIFGGVLV
jgi:hypothetical protein